MKLLKFILAAVVVLAIFHHHSSKLPIVYSGDSGKCYNNCTDPNRPFFDLWGNQFSYDGKLLHLGRCPYTDPISHQPNPYCPPIQPIHDEEFQGK